MLLLSIGLLHPAFPACFLGTSWGHRELCSRYLHDDLPQSLGKKDDLAITRLPVAEREPVYRKQYGFPIKSGMTIFMLRAEMVWIPSKPAPA